MSFHIYSQPMQDFCSDFFGDSRADRYDGSPPTGHGNATAEGKAYTVRYEAVNAMLLNEFLKAHRRLEQQEATIAKQQEQIEALTAGLQRVSAQVEMSRRAPQMVLNNQ